MTEKRQQPRAISVFKPACLKLEGKRRIAILRDFGEEGAGFQGLEDVRVGQELLYRFGDRDYCAGKVIWSHKDRFGVANDLSFSNRLMDEEEAYRSVRVNMNCSGQLFLNGAGHEAHISNFGQRGMCIESDAAIVPGMRATIRCGSRYLENAVAKWAGNNRAGFMLASPLPVHEMSQLAAA